jgi:antitoxin component YwqK of YwqJK toxin-antitoxin module
MRFVVVFVMSGLLLGAKGQKGVCPEGSRAVGDPPPKGYELICWKDLTYQGRWQHGMSTYWHKNGQKKEEGTYKHGKQHGNITRWHANGQKRLEGEYKDGKRHGKWTYWSQAGKRLGTNQWTNGSGAITVWYDNGQKEYRSEYKDGELQGKDTNWHDNGQKKSEGEYKDGRKHGKRTHWSQSGKRLGTNQWTNGSGSVTFWYDNGQKREQGEIRKNIKRRGKWTFWSPKGQIGGGRFRGGMPVGVATMFMGETPITCERKRSLRTCLYANGNRASESTWVGGAQLIGRKCWDEAGKAIPCPD